MTDQKKKKKVPNFITLQPLYPSELYKDLIRSASADIVLLHSLANTILEESCSYSRSPFYCLIAARSQILRMIVKIDTVRVKEWKVPES